MLKRNALLMVLTLLSVSATASAELVVEAGYVRASLPGSTTTSAYMALKNTGDAELVVTSANSPAAGLISFHSTMNHDGMMHMMDMESLKIAAHQSLKLESGGTHLMLENMPAMLAVDSKVELVFRFADGKKKSVSLPVQSVLADKH